MFIADLQQAYTESNDNDIGWKYNYSNNDLASIATNSNGNNDGINGNSTSSNTINTGDDFLLVLEGLFKFDKAKLFSISLSETSHMVDIKWRPSVFPIAEMIITLTSDNVAKLWLVSRVSPIHAGTVTTTSNTLTGGFSRIFHGIHGYVPEANVIQELTLHSTSTIYNNPKYQVAWINHGMSSSSETLLHSFYTGTKGTSTSSSGGAWFVIITTGESVDTSTNNDDTSDSSTFSIDFYSVDKRSLHSSSLSPSRLGVSSLLPSLLSLLSSSSSSSSSSSLFPFIIGKFSPTSGRNPIFVDVIIPTINNNNTTLTLVSGITISDSSKNFIFLPQVIKSIDNDDSNGSSSSSSMLHSSNGSSSIPVYNDDNDNDDVYSATSNTTNDVIIASLMINSPSSSSSSSSVSLDSHIVTLQQKADTRVDCIIWTTNSNYIIDSNDTDDSDDIVDDDSPENDLYSLVLVPDPIYGLGLRLDIANDRVLLLLLLL